MGDLTAYVSNIQRFSVHDGPGIRTTFFLLGCPLRCKWCQNPETINPTPQIMMNHQLCARCGACIEACPADAIHVDENGAIITDLRVCSKCFACVKSCNFSAREVTGKSYSVDDLFGVLIRDEEFYRTSGGGVTASGGEPLLQPDFCKQLFYKLKASGIHTAMETCGYAGWGSFEKILDITDLFLYDIKLLDGKKHEKWTGKNNDIILANIKKLSGLGKQIIIRIPLIPGVNDDDEEFRAIVDFVKSLKTIEEIHILPFHQIGSSKYDMIGRDYELSDLDVENSENIDHCENIARQAGFRVSVGGAGFKTTTETRTAGKN